jgi:hypothetical protein
MKAKENTSGTRHVASLKPTDPRSQFQPPVAQAKFRAVAPLAYRPQPVPRVLQLKRHEVKRSGEIAAPQNAVRSPFISPAPQMVSPILNRVAQPRGQAKPPCVQAKMSSSLRNNPLGWSVRKPPSVNGVHRGHSIQLAAAKAAPMAEAVEVEAKAEVKMPAKLCDLAALIHKEAGGSNQNTTGVARLKNGKLVVYTQLSVATVAEAAKAFGIAAVTKTKGAGYHVEVSMYIDHEDDLVAIGASQGFCPHCRVFLKAKGIEKQGDDRPTNDQVWYSPEFYLKREKEPKTAPYPWAYELDSVEGRRVTHKTRAAYIKWYRARTDGEDPPWLKFVVN